ncbi:Hypothetical protein A7982_03551 [Minicystis rosea]|nr:Hypothetical protein A7982_03551 [Minicystis rosea]
MTLVKELLPRGDPNVPSGHFRGGHGESALDLAALDYAARPEVLLAKNG